MKKGTLIFFILAMMNCFSLSADDLYVNGQKLSVYPLHVYDENGEEISRSDLKAMSIYGFDYDTWHHLGNLVIVSECLGVSGVLIGVAGNLIRKNNIDLAANLKLCGLLSVIAAMTVGVIQDQKYNIWLGDMRKGPQLSLSTHGIGITYSF